MVVPKRSVVVFGITALLMIGFLITVLVSRAERGDRSIYMDAVNRLKGGYTDKGYWVGDVTELYRLGCISKEVAEADTAPLKPLVGRPRPYGGYYVRAMLSGPSLRPGADWNTETTSLRGQTSNRETCAFCIYPAEGGGPGRPIYITCPVGIFSKPSDGNQPVLEWPTGDWRNVWAIVD